MTDSTAVPVMNHGWTFKGWRAFLEDWIADDRLKRAILADFFDRLSAFGRTVCGLCDRVHWRASGADPAQRARRDPANADQQLDEAIDLYALSAAAIDAAALAGAGPMACWSPTTRDRRIHLSSKCIPTSSPSVDGSSSPRT